MKQEQRGVLSLWRKQPNAVELQTALATARDRTLPHSRRIHAMKFLSAAHKDLVDRNGPGGLAGYLAEVLRGLRTELYSHQTEPTP